jgi:DNA-binding XRE family transcriptional regulator
MVNTAKIKGLIVEREMTQAQVAQALGIADDTFYRKMRAGKFTTDEAYKLIQLLNIENPAEVFFMSTN